MYTCCRGGNKRGHIGPNKLGKTRKHNQTRKLGDYCIDRMIATEYLMQVMGGWKLSIFQPVLNSECRHLPLPNSVREEIRRQFAADISGTNYGQ